MIHRLKHFSSTPNNVDNQFHTNINNLPSPTSKTMVLNFASHTICNPSIYCQPPCSALLKPIAWLPFLPRIEECTSKHQRQTSKTSITLFPYINNNKQNHTKEKKTKIPQVIIIHSVHPQAPIPSILNDASQTQNGIAEMDIPQTTST